MEDRDVSDVFYLYGFVPADAPAPPPALTGVGEESVALLDLGPLCAVIARLPGDGFGAGAVESRLNDLAWVGQQGLAHERVVLWFVDHSRILPARLLSLHSGEAALRASLANSLATLAARLETLGERREWNLKVSYDSERMARHGAEVSAAVRDLDADIEAAPPGRRYLLQRKRTDLLKDEVGRAARRIADELLDSLRAHADDVRTLPLASAEAASGAVVLNAALLVDRARDTGLKAAAEAAAPRLEALGVHVSFSGPWAAYRFVEEGTDG
jgi:hypothetical protein